MIEFIRKQYLPELLSKKSHFLFGARSTGKTFLINQQLKDIKTFSLLDNNTFSQLARRPSFLSESITKNNQSVVIDEIQKLPILLDEVQKLIQEKNIHFLLTGSSARKLKRGGANLLGGRAWVSSLFPLSYSEIPAFNLLKYINRGGLPHIYPSENHTDELKNYVSLYLREEIQAEALTRNISNFARFLDIIALQNNEELNFEGISSDTAVSGKTIQSYIQILEDTLLGFSTPAFLRTKKRKAITRSKFLLFDIGVTNTLAMRGKILPKSELFGRAFEHFLMLELRTYLSYNNVDLKLQYWRSTSKFEVDCIIGNMWALEFKSTDMISEKHLKGLKALKEEGLIKNHAIISLDPEQRTINGIKVYPWKDFLDLLWSDKIITKNK